MIGGLEKTFSEFVNYLADEVHYFNKKYFIPGLVFMGIVGFSLPYTVQPLVKNVIPKIDSFLNSGNQLYYDGRLYHSKKEVEDVKKQEFLSEEEDREKKRLKEVKEEFLFSLKNLDNVKNPKTKMELTEQLMDNYERLRDNK